MSSIPRVYLAGRFRGDGNAAIQRNIDFASMFQPFIAKAKCMPVCVHKMEGLSMHDINQEDLGKFWLDATLGELDTCQALVLVPGWQTSTGTYAEVVRAFELGLSVFEAIWDRAILVDQLPKPANAYAWSEVNGLIGRSGDAKAVFGGTHGDFASWAEQATQTGGA